MLYVGGLAGPLATWSSTHAIRALPAAVSSLGFLATPALGVLGATLALGEPLTCDLAAGGGLILLGVAATLRR